MNPNDRRVRLSCYAMNLSMSVVGTLSPLLLLTFRSLYDLSYSLLGLLVLINFCTQLTVDLIFSFFSHKFNIEKTVKTIPVLTILGLFVYAAAPWLFPSAVFVGLAIGTAIFLAAAGLGEVLISPVVASLPSDNPERDMSKLHSVYAWGVVGIVLFGTLFLFFVGAKAWQLLALLLSLIPLSAALLLLGTRLPKMQTPDRVSGVVSQLKNRRLWLCVLAIFLGGAAECTMAQWSSSYLERAIGIPKLWGDIFGMALFSVMLGLGRSLYAKYGKNITRVLFWGAIGATVCYFTAAVSSVEIVGLLACAMTGLCTSMMWPGCLIAASDRFPNGGVFLYALMAAGGDLGASVSPQLVGIVTDLVSANPQAFAWLGEQGASPDRLGMKLGMLVGMLFPLAAIGVYFALHRHRGAQGLSK